MELFAADWFFWEKGKKNGIPLYPNLVNLKSNTMKNTMQRYGGFANLQEADQKKLHKIFIFLSDSYNFVQQTLQIPSFGNNLATSSLAL